ncbi:uncharacterized protein LOC144432590 [Glandiceps talaboti]
MSKRARPASGNQDDTGNTQTVTSVDNKATAECQQLPGPDSTTGELFKFEENYYSHEKAGKCYSLDHSKRTKTKDDDHMALPVACSDKPQDKDSAQVIPQQVSMQQKPWQHHDDTLIPSGYGFMSDVTSPVNKETTRNCAVHTTQPAFTSQCSLQSLCTCEKGSGIPMMATPQNLDLRGSPAGSPPNYVPQYYASGVRGGGLQSSQSLSMPHASTRQSNCTCQDCKLVLRYSTQVANIPHYRKVIENLPDNLLSLPKSIKKYCEHPSTLAGPCQCFDCTFVGAIENQIRKETPLSDSFETCVRHTLAKLYD